MRKKIIEICHDIDNRNASLIFHSFMDHWNTDFSSKIRPSQYVIFFLA